ncbi:MAG TPA: M56 family metallopeptidase [Chryseolinea sp.]|nr:M56 family metallopeptidase [Chryseolinea sp.]
MKLIALFSSTGMQALGWTLVNSLWQGLLCSMVVILAVRCLPSQKSSIRYLIATGGLILLSVVSIVTFLYISQAIPPHQASLSPAPDTVSYTFIAGKDVSIAPYFNAVTNLLQTNLDLIVMAWLIGALFFSLRVISGYLYIKRIRAGALYLEAAWQDHIQALANRLGINRSIGLAESLWIQAPVVIGYIKPMILLPVGMLSGLSADQLESILIHELVHIRRSDYIINIIQSMIEALFFFNPWVWMLSSIIRREREHCCDDMVVEVYGDPLAYARALATLEEAKLSRAGLALSLAENKNQLLNRIKRIMEKSVQRYSGREKVIPVVLLVLGLMCASWLTIQSERDNVVTVQGSVTHNDFIAQDTSKKSRTFHYSRKQHSDPNENGEISEESLDDSSYDDDVTFYIDAMPEVAPLPEVEEMDFHFAMPDVPPIPDMDLEMLEMPVPPTFDFAPMDFAFGYSFDGDTLHPHTWTNARDWEDFGKEFEKNFKEKFSDFYEKHEEDMKKIMEEVEEKFKGAGQEWEEKMNELASRQAELAERQAERWNDVASRDQLREMTRMQYDIDTHHRDEERVRMSEGLKNMSDEARNIHERQASDMKRLESEMHGLEKKMAEVEKALQKELVKDGYIKADEKVNNIDVSDDGIEINGKKIKSSDEKKYRDIMKKFEQPVPGRRE